MSASNNVSKHSLREQSETSVFKSVLRSVVDNHSQAFFSNTCCQHSFSEIAFDVIFEEWFWMTVISNVSQKCCQQLYSITILGTVSNVHSQRLFSSNLLKQLLSTFIFRDCFLMCPRNGFWMSVVSNVSQNRRQQVFSEVFLEMFASIHSQTSSSSNLLKQVFPRVILRDCFLRCVLKSDFEWVFQMMSLRTVGVRCFQKCS